MQAVLDLFQVPKFWIARELGKEVVVVGPWLLAWICSKFPNLYIAKGAKELVHSQ
jgi:hypothetical protein